MQRNRSRHYFSALLATVLVLGSIPMSAFAAEIETAPSIEPIIVEAPMLATDGELGTGTPDGTPPVLNGITLSTTTVSPGSSIEVIADASDDVSGVEYVAVQFFCEETQKKVSCHAVSTYFNEENWEEVNYPDGKFHGIIELDNYAESGIYKLVHVGVYDIAGNHKFYTADPAYSLGDVMPDGVNDIQFTVKGSSVSDGTPPVLKNVTLSTTSVTPPGSIDVTVEASDDISGVSFGFVYFDCSETGKHLSCALDNNYYDSDTGEYIYYPDGNFHGTITIDQYALPGNFEINNLYLYDEAGNVCTYFKDKETSDDPRYPIMPDNIKNLQFTVSESDTSDGIPPVLNGIAISTTSVTVPGSFEVIADVSDNLSGVKYVSVEFVCPETEKSLACALKDTYYDHETNQTVPYSDAKFHGTVEIDQYVESGTFEISFISVRDAAGNAIDYNYWAMPDSVKSIQLHVFNTTPDVTTSVSNPGFIDSLESAENNAYIAADYSGDAILTEEAFNAIAGTDKTLDLASEGITWRFNGSDITEEVKPIDLKVEISQVEKEGSSIGEAIADKLGENPGVVMKFAENGVLPGKATIQVKVDYAMREYLGSDQNLCVYYYNNQTGQLELVAENLTVINDTYVEFSITHCSCYVLTRKLPESENPEGCGYAYGDANHDGKVNAKDATLVLQYSVGTMREGQTFCERCADATGDGRFNAKDSTMMLQKSSGLLDKFPVEN